MLGKLFGSNARVKILKLFLSDPKKSYYIRQISRDFELQLNSVRRELENLEKFGLLLSGEATETEARKELYPDNILVKEKIKEDKKRADKKVSITKTDKKYYRVNKDFVLFEELKALIVKAQVLYEEDFVKKLQQIGNIKLLIMSGFFVNNTYSQVDLLIVGRLQRNKLVKLITDLEKELGREVNFTFLDMKEFKYRRDITDVFLYEILEGKNLVIIDEIGL